MAGSTDSSDFPGVGAGSADSTLVEGSDVFVAKLDANLRTLLAATFLGGSIQDFAGALALDSMGNVYAAGFTVPSTFLGSEWARPTVPLLEPGKAFVAKLDANLRTLLAVTFLGGSGVDAINALTLDSMGNVYVAGWTASSDFPGVGAGSADSTFAGGSEAFVAKLDANLSRLLAATFLGGSAVNNEQVHAASPWTARGMSM